jgi:long-chain fatty acid transport protein
MGTIATPAWVRADTIMKGIARSASSAAALTTPKVALYGTESAATAFSLGHITAIEQATIEGTLTAFGYPTSANIATADAVFKGAAAQYTATATLLGDQRADIKQTGSGIAPILSVNITPSENLNIGIRYEMITKIKLTNKTTSDILVGFTGLGTPVTMFPDGALTASDMPAMLSVGVDYKPGSNVKISLGSDYFFDKSADYGHTLDLDLNSSTPPTAVKNRDIIAHNGWSLQTGLEVKLTEKLLVSGGYVFANKGVNNLYQTELAYGLATHTFGAGGAYKVWDNHLLINVGGSCTLYQSDENIVDHLFSATNTIYSARETYSTRTLLFGVGLDFNF